MFGYVLGELVNDVESGFCFVYLDDVVINCEVFVKYLVIGELYDYEYCLLKKNGEVLWVCV